MTKEQEAIEKLTNGEKIDFNTLVRKFKKEGIENFVVTKKEYIATVLNMLKEKDKKIEKLRNNNKDLLRKLRNRIKEVKKLERKDYKSIVTKQGKTLEERAEQLKKKDKIIDLMAETFYKKFKAELLLEYGFENEEQLKQYFKEIAERKSEE